MEPGLAQLIGGAWGLDRATFEAVEQAPHGLRDVLIIMLLAGASETLGQAVVLILNRVSRTRFFVSLLLGGLSLIAEALLWIASLWIVAGLLGVDKPSFLTAVRIIGLAYAPLLFGFFVFLPYLGPIVSRLLRVWVLLAAVLGTSVAFDIAPLPAAIAVAIGFLGRWLLLALFAQIALAGNRLFGRNRDGAHPAPQLVLETPERRG
jgi:hypothetical protein